MTSDQAGGYTLDVRIVCSTRDRQMAVSPYSWGITTDRFLQDTPTSYEVVRRKRTVVIRSCVVGLSRAVARSDAERGAAGRAGIPCRGFV